MVEDEFPTQKLDSGRSQVLPGIYLMIKDKSEGVKPFLLGKSRISAVTTALAVRRKAITTKSAVINALQHTHHRSENIPRPAETFHFK